MLPTTTQRPQIKSFGHGSTGLKEQVEANGGLFDFAILHDEARGCYGLDHDIIIIRDALDSDTLIELDDLNASDLVSRVCRARFESQNLWDTFAHMNLTTSKSDQSTRLWKHTMTVKNNLRPLIPLGDHLIHPSSMTACLIISTITPHLDIKRLGQEEVYRVKSGDLLLCQAGDDIEVLGDVKGYVVQYLYNLVSDMTFPPESPDPSTSDSQSLASVNDKYPAQDIPTGNNPRSTLTSTSSPSPKEPSSALLSRGVGQSPVQSSGSSTPPPVSDAFSDPTSKAGPAKAKKTTEEARWSASSKVKDLDVWTPLKGPILIRKSEAPYERSRRSLIDFDRSRLIDPEF